jgi:hypothetical protein
MMLFVAGIKRPAAFYIDHLSTQSSDRSPWSAGNVMKVARRLCDYGESEIRLYDGVSAKVAGDHRYSVSYVVLWR